jgi:succinyl-CoA synthetase alpha subunit
MASAVKVMANLYRDSVTLMQLSASLAKLPGIERAFAVMASASGLGLLREQQLLADGLAASENDVVIVVAGRGEREVAAALKSAERALAEEPPAAAAVGAMSPRSLAMAAALAPDANLALISTPGAYAAAEAEKALRLGLHVMLFSDNVSLRDEVALKRLARERRRLLMGPDCGTAVINGVPLAFANVVRRGAIGCVAASGTGLQQVTCLIDRLGAGISQAIGTGGRDLSADVGGMAMLEGIAALAADAATRVIVLISKPPSPSVAERVLAAASRAAKPVVVNFLGAGPKAVAVGNLYAAATLEEAAYAAVALGEGRRPTSPTPRVGPPAAMVKPGAGRRYIRGLFTGGTFCHEAHLILKRSLGEVRSNTAVDARDALGDPFAACGHALIDLGDDVFTRGRPHPMIDHSLRNERLSAEAAKPQVAVVLFDVVLGYGSHVDPAAAMAATLREARARSPGVVFVAFVCGTERDPQGLREQELALREAGVVLADCNAAAARLAAAIVGEAR